MRRKKSESSPIERLTERCSLGRLKKVTEVQLEGIELDRMGGMPVYEVRLKVITKGWMNTGPLRYRHVTDERLFRLQVSLNKDAHLLGLWTHSRADTSVPVGLA